MIIPYCNKCDLCIINNFTPVKPRGNNQGSIMFVGEAPGYSERKQGYAFVGNAGKYLQKWITKYNFDKYSYITNVVKCRPPTNRTPNIIEINKCRSYLFDEIKEVKPNIIVLLGATAISTFYDNDIKVSNFINRKIDVIGKYIIVFAYHPSYILRSEKYDEYIKTFNLLLAIFRLKINNLHNIN